MDIHVHVLTGRTDFFNPSLTTLCLLPIPVGLLIVPCTRQWRPVLVPMTGMRYNSLLCMCTLNTLTWNYLTIQSMVWPFIKWYGAFHSNWAIKISKWNYEIFQYKCIVLSHKYQNARKLQFSDFGTLLSYHKLAYISCDTGITVTEGKIKKQLLFKKFRMKMKKKYGDIKTFTY